MPMFGHLGDDIFLPFSRANRRLNEECLVAVYERFYKDRLRFPRPGDVVEAICEVIRSNPGLWNGDPDLEEIADSPSQPRRRARASATPEAASDEARRRAGQVYAYLRKSGWLEEERFGIQVTVEMAPGALALMSSLHRIREGMSVQFSGTLVVLNNTLRAIADRPGDNATGLETVRRNLEEFVRHLRAILSDLKRVKQEMTRGDSHRERVRVFLDGFVKELLLKDFAAIHTTNHPYRYKNETMAAVRALYGNAAILDDLGASLARFQNPKLFDSPDASHLHRVEAVESCRRQAEADLVEIETVLGHLDEMFERIRTFQKQLEERLRNMIRYKGRGKGELAKRTDALLDRLVARMRDDRDGSDAPTVEGLVVRYDRPFGEDMQATPRKARAQVSASVAVVREADPVDVFLQGLKREYHRRLKPSDETVAAFVEAKLGGRSNLLASEFELESVDDFLAFDALSLAARRGRAVPAFKGRFATSPAPGMPAVSNAYIVCPNFSVTRIDRIQA